MFHFAQILMMAYVTTETLINVGLVDSIGVNNPIHMPIQSQVTYLLTPADNTNITLTNSANTATLSSRINTLDQLFVLHHFSPDPNFVFIQSYLTGPDTMLGYLGADSDSILEGKKPILKNLLFTSTTDISLKTTWTLWPYGSGKYGTTYVLCARNSFPNVCILAPGSKSNNPQVQTFFLKPFKKGRCGADPNEIAALNAAFYYNWYINADTSSSPQLLNREYTPMITDGLWWGEAEGVVKAYENGTMPIPRHLLVLNEPDLIPNKLCTPESSLQTVVDDLFDNLLPFRKKAKNFLIGTPALAFTKTSNDTNNGCSNDSNYYCCNFFNAFYGALGNNKVIQPINDLNHIKAGVNSFDFTAVHLYNGYHTASQCNPNNFAKQVIDDLTTRYDWQNNYKPIWITEFNPSNWGNTYKDKSIANDCNAAQVLAFYQQLLPQLDSLDFVQRYYPFDNAYHGEYYYQQGTNVLFDGNHKLTPLGQYYSDYPFN